MKATSGAQFVALQLVKSIFFSLRTLLSQPLRCFCLICLLTSCHRASISTSFLAGFPGGGSSVTKWSAREVT